MEKELNDYYKQIEKIPVFTAEEEKEWFEKYKNATDLEEKNIIRQHIVKHNLRLVLKIVCKHMKTIKKGNIDIFELIQEGNIGLFDAVENLDISYGNKFSTYAFNYVKKNIYNSIYDNNRPIRWNTHCNTLDGEVRKIERDYLEKTAEELKYTPKVIKKLANDLGVGTLTLTRILQERIIYSLDDELYDNNGVYLGTHKEYLLSEENAEEVILENQRMKEFEKVFDEFGLSEMEKEIIMKRNGVDCEKPQKVEELAEHFGVSKAQVSKLYYKGISRIRTSESFKKVSPFK